MDNRIISALKFDYRLIRFHFWFSYWLMFFLPFIDIIIFIPTVNLFPRLEFILSLVIDLIMIILTILSNNDIEYLEESFTQMIFQPICLTGRILYGFCVFDLIMFAIQMAYLVFAWPYFYKNIRLIWYNLQFTSKYFRHIAETLQKDLAIFELNTVDAYPDFHLNLDTFDYDGFALWLIQTVRLSLIIIKTLLGQKIRHNISLRNIRLGLLLGRKPDPKSLFHVHIVQKNVKKFIPNYWKNIWTIKQF